MANKVRGEVGFEADGRAWTLAYSTNALCELEEELDDVVVSIADLLNGAGGKRRLSTLRAVFRAGLLDRHPEVTTADAGRLIDAIGMKAAFGKVSEAIALAFPVPEDAVPLDLTAAPARRKGGNGRTGLRTGLS
jgi:hypothetical protein